MAGNVQSVVAVVRAIVKTVDHFAVPKTKPLEYSKEQVAGGLKNIPTHKW
jgi:hypothetical protein